MTARDDILSGVRRALHDADRSPVHVPRGYRAGPAPGAAVDGEADEATLELLRELHVDYAQGFHVARPKPLSLPGLSAGTEPVRTSS